jgi:hypothetical protein
MPDAHIIIAGDSNALGFLNNGPAPYAPTAQVQIWADSRTGSYQWNYMDPGFNTGTPANPQTGGRRSEARTMALGPCRRRLAPLDREG